MTSSLIPGIPARLIPRIMSCDEMPPGILETPEAKQQLLDEMKPTREDGFRKERTFARKDLPDGRFCVVRVIGFKSTKRPRGGAPKTTYKFIVCTEVHKPVVPLHPHGPNWKAVGDPYLVEVDGGADALWAAVCAALEVQRGAPENLCVHCYGRTVLDGTDTCIKCALGLQHAFEARGDHGTTPIRVEDRKTPQPRP